jgi:hypothetical protein
MWRMIVLLICVPLWLCGCLATTHHDRAAVPSANLRHGSTGDRYGDVPTPQLFDFTLDLSNP